MVVRWVLALNALQANIKMVREQHSAKNAHQIRTLLTLANRQKQIVNDALQKKQQALLKEAQTTTHASVDVVIITKMTKESASRVPTALIARNVMASLFTNLFRSQNTGDRTS